MVEGGKRLGLKKKLRRLLGRWIARDWVQVAVLDRVIRGRPGGSVG